MTKRIQPRNGVGWIAAVVVGLAFSIWFHRGFLFSGFTRFEGDWGDGRFVALVASHWAHPLQFPGGWKDLGMFFPYADTLAYSDTFILHGFVVAPLRWLGLGVLPSFQWALIVTSAGAYAATVAFMRLGPRAHWLIAIAAGVLVAFPNALALSSAHPQLQTISLGSVVLLLALTAWRSKGPFRTAVWMSGSAAMLALIITSTFYAGWMLVIGLVASGLLTVGLGAAKGYRLKWGRLLPLTVGALVGFGLVIAVFFAIYGSALSRGLARSLDDALGSTLRISELAMVGDANFLWGQSIERLFAEIRPYEFWYTPTPLLVLACVALVFLAFVKWKTATTWVLIGLSFAIAGIVAWLVPVSYAGWSPWELIYNIPGATAVRAVGRFELLAVFLIGLAVPILVASLWRHVHKATRIVLAVAVVVICVEQINLDERQLHSDLVVSATDEVREPPEECRVFVVVDPRWDIPGFAEQIDALAIAQSTGIPTINGYSGWVPPDWQVDTDSPNYLRFARSWSGRWFMQGLCGYRFADNSWLSPDELRAALAEAARQPS